MSGSDQMRATLEELKYKRLDLLAMRTKTLKIEKIREILEALKTQKEGVFSFYLLITIHRLNDFNI